MMPPEIEQSKNPLRILVIGSNAKGSLENAYFRGFLKAGAKNTDIFDTGRYRKHLRGAGLAARAVNRGLSRYSAIKTQRAILKHLSSRKYDAFIVFKGMELSRETLDECRALQPGALWVNVNPDDPFNITSRGSTNSFVIDSLGFYDIYCIWSRTLALKLKERGCRNVEYLPFGYDEDTHKPPGDAEVEEDAVSFVGAWDPERESVLEKLAGYDLRIYGHAWDRVSRRSPLRSKVVPRNVYSWELSKIIYSSAVSLNILRPQNLGAHNMRTFEIPAMNGLMITTRSGEQDGFFPEGRASLMYGGMNELREKIDLALSDKRLANDIRSSGFKFAQGHGYSERAKRLLKIISNAKKPR